MMLKAEDIGFTLNGSGPSEPNGADIHILTSVEEFIRPFLALPEPAYLPLATLIAATHIADKFYAFPYLALTSPVKQCGKTRVLELCNLLCARPRLITSSTAAALFRMMADCPTLLYDEVEAFRSKNVSEGTQIILAILNCGYKKGGEVPRCEPPTHKVTFFPVYGPKVFTAIGSLPGTLADRSICITMQRRPKSQKLKRFSHRKTPTEAELVKGLLETWAKSKGETIQNTYESLPDLEFIEDREAEIWMPLFAVCAVAAPERILELKECALALSKTKAADDIEESFPLRLLADVREVWPAGKEHLPTVSLLEKLKAIPESPWNDAGHELNPRRLARMLRPFGVAPRDIRIPDKTGIKGYLWAEFEAAFSRYLPLPDKISATCATSRMDKGENANS